MSETDEGMGGRKWGLERLEDGSLYLTQGKYRLALLESGDAPDVPMSNRERREVDFEKVKFLLVTAPQLWDAANEVLKVTQATNLSVHIGAQSQQAFTQLANMVAKAVNKTDWKDVAQ